jgi:hypothetical protein
MLALQEFLLENAALLVAIVALAISLRANHISSQTYKLSLAGKRDSDRVLLFEKICESLNEVDRQHARIATLTMVLAQKILFYGSSEFRVGYRA